MAQLAIKGHATRGIEVIELLEMLGGINKDGCYGSIPSFYYFINENRNIDIYYGCISESDFIVFTLEDFLEKFPYKVGDKVITTDKFIGTITNIKWQGDSFFVGKEEGDIVYTVQVSTNAQITYQKEYLQPYKEETMEEKLEQIILEIPAGYEFFGINDDNKVVLTKKQLKYPQTYKECCEILEDVADCSLSCFACGLLNNLQKLLLCRNAYWKIAGEQMGLGELWEPQFQNCNILHYCIFVNNKGNIHKYSFYASKCLLAFPTEEMRDAFYENFKDLIEKCKELL